MTQVVTVSIVEGQVQFPPGTQPVDHLVVTLTGRTDPVGNKYTQTAVPGATQVTFTGPNPDTYDIVVQALDASSNVLITRSGSSVIVPAPPPPNVTLTVPLSASGSVSNQ